MRAVILRQWRRSSSRHRVVDRTTPCLACCLAMIALLARRVVAARCFFLGSIFVSDLLLAHPISSVLLWPWRQSQQFSGMPLRVLCAAVHVLKRNNMVTSAWFTYSLRRIFFCFTNFLLGIFFYLLHSLFRVLFCFTNFLHGFFFYSLYSVFRVLFCFSDFGLGLFFDFLLDCIRFTNFLVFRLYFLFGGFPSQILHESYLFLLSEYKLPKIKRM